MKKKTNLLCSVFPGHRKIFRTMRISLFLVLISTLQIIAGNSYSQSIRLTLDMKNVTIKDVLSQIEEQSDLYFLYDNGLIDVYRKVDINVQNEQITVILNKLFGEDGVSAVIRDRHIILTPAEGSASQQILKISGKVTDSSGAPLPGVTVVVKGTTQGTVTDAYGNYSLSNVLGNAELIFSFVGMKTQEVFVSGKSVINMIMQEETIGLEEVVAIGYGTMKRSDLTGSVASLDKTEIENRSATNVLQSMEGKIAGITIKQTTSLPGDAPDIYIRGLNSISASNAPLVIIDGVPGDLSLLNPNDIESIDVLKDASSSAIYGARGANGVILVTTKRGTGMPKFSYNVYYGINQISKKLDLMNADDWLHMRQREVELAGLPHEPVDVLSEEEYANYQAGIVTDWQDVVFKNALINEHNLSVSGAENTLNYYFSVNYLNHDYVAGDFNLQRKSVRANLNKEFGNWLKVENNLQVLENDRKGSADEGDFYATRSLSPYASPYDPEGNYLIWPIQSETELISNPLKYKFMENFDDEKTILENLKIDIKLPVKGLHFLSNFGVTSITDHSKSYQTLNTPTGFKRNRQARRSSSFDYRWIFENIIKYEKNIKQHSFDFTGLYSAEQSESENQSQTVFGFINDAIMYNNFSAAENFDPPSSSATEWSMTSLMARINYSYNDKYLITATYRRDGYSAFGTDRKYGDFPSVAVGWRILQENFMANLSFISQLKLRVSWGKNGNQAVNPYSSKSIIKQYSRAYPFGGPNDGLYGFGPTTLANSLLGWEVTESVNLGIDFGLFDNKISGDIDLYHTSTSDLLLTRGIPYTTGYSSIFDNIGSTKNDGLGLNLKTVNIKNNDGFNWNTSFNLTYNKNEIIDLYGDKKDDIGNSWFIGEPIHVYYDYVFDGIWQEDDDIQNSHMPGMQPGTVKLKDISGPDGKPDGIIDPNDRKIVGNREPNLLWGLTNYFQYKGFDLSIFIQGVHGVTGQNPMIGNNQYFARLDLDFWLPENPSNRYPTSDLSKSSTYKGAACYEDASFIRLKDVTLGYTLPNNLIRGVDRLRLYLNATNLYTITDWLLYDPETLSDMMPMTRSVILGLTVSF